MRYKFDTKFIKPKCKNRAAISIKLNFITPKDVNVKFGVEILSYL